ncbi:interferon-induced GTP-binding protein Mx-like isoform X1 [Falco biarmicus]|uniref:interferon-induced GTP-binding protein Mx-like isoform X1 n=1 Tax=Falco cherrug TaxID=345164 RepID=UPI001886A9C3|nr:interferon-induced GTP-binding protein Mx-like isoform X1 [Falco cherrug]XP_037232947.1 interferon-induced GTP-binding protein Mx1 isoform X1 [Falco rusticolus]XP_037232948.1 interferon-induced GTP-binding protein Mx1 isoform X1 [Falco rusticolus]XP_056183853.1 interferon-induced GTP-binding protein Mx-like isoform X1 [Falco biarmicus]
MDNLHSSPKNQKAMGNKGVAVKQPSQKNKSILKKDHASPFSQPSSEAFAVPLPPDFEDEDLSENTIERKPNYEEEEWKEQDYGEQDKQATEHTLHNQYEKRIRPCIDLIDSLRALGVEKELALPAIAVIGDQSSGKSSVLEALSGIALPRGNGIVTRCPLELKLKRIPATQAWKGKICYRNIISELQNASEVEKAIREAQDVVAGTRGAISGELISLEIQSPGVPDLTLIDLPGIARVAVGDQPKDIGEQIKMLLKRIIGCKETLNLVVVPCNVDIATTEALKMAQEVDPSGERTLGILTKPDLVDKGTEESIINIIQNKVIPLKKGYMIVKCRGQQDIHNKLALATAIQQERIFFKTHKYFSILLDEGRATIPHLAEKLTNELVRHIIKTLPTLENQIREVLQKTLQDLQKYRRGTPKTESEKLIFLTDLIKLFNQDISQTMRGEEQLFGNEIRLFTKIRKEFRTWEIILLEHAAKVKESVPMKVWKYEDQYRGREFPGFTNYGTFEDIIKEQITGLEELAVGILNSVIGLVEEKFMELTKRHFENFQNLNRAIKTRIEDIREKQAAEAERYICTQFKMERIVYSQDDLYISDLKSVEAEDTPKAGNRKELQVGSVLNQQPSLVQEMVSRTKAYFSGASKRLSNQIPLIILSFALHDFGENLQTTMLHLLQEKDKLSHLLQEDSEAAKHRSYLSERVNRLTKACQYLRDFSL